MKFVIADIVNKNFNPYSLEETKILIKNIWWTIDKIFLQNRNYPSSASYIWTWKAREIAQYCLDNKIDVFVINWMLKPSVYNTLRDYFPRETQIWDKIDLILHIFEKHAHTKEAKLQIEYAKIKYELPRLKWWWKQLSNLGAWIWTRWPWEKIMEIKRRHYEKRLKNIEKQLKHRQDVLHSQRKWRKFMKKAILIWYSNVWKSTLFNALTWKNVYVKDILFATLDNRIAKLKTEYPIDVLVIDTIWFIHWIPPLVLNSFLPTLDEIKFADIILVVLDVSLLEKDKKYFDLQFETVLNVLERFKNFIEKKHFQDYENLNYNKKVILVFNKADKLTKQVDSLPFYIDKFRNIFNIDNDFWIWSAFDKQEVKLLKSKILKERNVEIER